MLTILSSFAQEESENISQNVKWRSKEKFKRGVVIVNTKRFLGYDKDKSGGLVINIEESKIVERIFKDYLDWKGYFTIANEFNDEGVPTIAGGKWHENTIQYILKNEKYKGDAHLQKYYTPQHLKCQSVKNNGRLIAIILKEIIHL